MSKLKNAFGHFHTITAHRNLVCRYCFRAGLYKQGLLHDLSKYTPTEFIAGVRYYQGNRSPNDIERQTFGYSRAWLHHKGRNRHHYEYWNDYLYLKGRGVTGPVPMPRRYVAEMFCDRLAACHIYNKDKYEDTMPLEYFNRAKERMAMDPVTKIQLESLLTYCYEHGEAAALKYIKDVFMKESDMTREEHDKWMEEHGY